MTEIRAELSKALADLAPDTGVPLRTGAERLLNALGYRSGRTVSVSSVEDFLGSVDASSKLTEKQFKLFKFWKAVEIVFQFTDSEVTKRPDSPDASSFDAGRKKSFLFLAVDMARDSHSRAYARTHLAETVRAVNRLFKMPVILLFRYESTLTLAAIHRRANKRDGNRDVLKKVSLVKDICAEDPHRAHVDIISGLSFDKMRGFVKNFDDLHEQWEKTLDIKELNKRFYKEIFDWFGRAVEDCKFPDDGQGEGSTERHIIRLITRLLFIWFMKEKKLVPDELFKEQFAKGALNDYSSDTTDYYRAILQNLFFATLNTEIYERSFYRQDRSKNSVFNEYHYRDRLTDPDAFLKKLKTVPFVNGGLFDCLDDFGNTSASSSLIDAFTDNSHNDLDVPASLFLDSDKGLFSIFRRYKFTVEESTPLDCETALDPELLGCVFENLLAAYNPETRDTARRETGSYYTPRPVVDYMVREALTEALAMNTTPTDGDSCWWRERLRYLLDYSDAMDDADDLFEEADRRTIVEAVAKIRTLDPAVGSGAFPMGILQMLTLVLRRLDPNNDLWEKIQKKRAKSRAGKVFDNQDQPSRDEALREISKTFEKYRESDFGRKLYLIQNGIYGVDIQPIACQIAKLRFFISLVIEQSPDSDAPNRGIKPLPNLETRIVAADSLIRLKSPDKILLHDDMISTRKKIETIREHYFLADSRPQKLCHVEKEKRLRNEFKNILQATRHDWITKHEQVIECKAEGFSNPVTRKHFREAEYKKLDNLKYQYDKEFDDANKVAEWDPYNQNAHARWFCANYMFGISDGFDVVIGNPPYIQLQNNKGYAGKRYRDVGYKTFQQRGDIYQLFYEHGCTLLKPSTGILAYITSNSWLKAQSGELLREYFVEEHMPLALLEMGKDVFENAVVDTAVLVVRNGKDRPVTCRAVDVEEASGNLFPPPKRDWGHLYSEKKRPWMVLSPVERAILEKMEAVGTPLRKWDIQIYYGIKTGCNDAFIVNSEVRDRLIAEHPSSEEILKPVLRGRDIKRYRANKADHWLIATFPSISLDIDSYPAIKRHLLSFGKERLSQEGCLLPGGYRSRKKTPHAWYELQDTCAYHEHFLEEKVIWIELVDRGRFAYDSTGRFVEATAFMATGVHMKYLCTFLNSELAYWYMLKTAPTSGMGVLRWKKLYVESMPVALPTLSANASMCGLIDEVLSTYAG